MNQSPTIISELLARHGIAPRKRLGQHFLADGNIIDKMVRTADLGPGDEVVEVGAGTGALTIAIADTGASVLAYEIDRGLASVLAEVVGERSNVDLRFEDAMRALPDALDAGPWKLVANLPYNVGTPLVLKLLRSAPQITLFAVMVQREVADRLVAVPGNKQYGLPSIVTHLTSQAHRAFVVPPQVFLPVPKVSSAVVVMTRRPGVDLQRIGKAIDLAAEAFRHRRKMLRATLDVAMLEEAGISPTARPEDLAPERFLDMADAYND
ncbi:MAG TPA: 16S rRNA (adenine(1518)-N(6)/adenine(1519)-N(6))-dimethyltransferase RsmA [Acidimicrobiia bacterium]|nr:16S rRNA (adenine(1518)-N(6)/adenine(1519)-N(6))-dimethyltransferase RsmA [Acidimicrobiia bacterium]